MPPRVGGTKRIISAHLQDLGGETYKCYETSPKSVFEKPHHRNTRPLQNFILYEGILDFRQLYVDTPEIIIIIITIIIIIIIIIPYGRINSRMTSYLKIVNRADKSGKFSPRGCSHLPEIQNTEVFITFGGNIPPKARIRYEGSINIYMKVVYLLRE